MLSTADPDVCRSGLNCSVATRQVLLRLRLWALYHLNELGDSAVQAVAVGEPLLDDAGRVLGPDHPDTLASRNNLVGACQEAGRAAEAIPLLERARPTWSGCWAHTPTPWPRGTTSPTPRSRRS